MGFFNCEKGGAMVGGCLVSFQRVERGCFGLRKGKTVPDGMLKGVKRSSANSGKSGAWESKPATVRARA